MRYVRECLTLKKHIQNFRRKFGKIIVSSKILSGDYHDQRDIAIKFCSDWLSGFHFTLQTSKFLFINVTAVTLGQGHGHRRIIQYIKSPHIGVT